MSFKKYIDNKLNEVIDNTESIMGQLLESAYHLHKYDSLGHREWFCKNFMMMQVLLKERKDSIDDADMLALAMSILFSKEPKKEALLNIQHHNKNIKSICEMLLKVYKDEL